MKILNIIIICLIFFGCVRHNQEPEHSVHFDRMTLQFSKELYEKDHLYLSSFGGELMKNIKLIALGYHAKKKNPTSIEEARDLMVKCTQQLLTKVNGNEAARPFLDHYPFGINDIEFSISFVDEDKKQFTDGTVAFAFTVKGKGKIYYCSLNPQTDLYEDLLEETYEEALKIVQNKPHIAAVDTMK